MLYPTRLAGVVALFVVFLLYLFSPQTAHAHEEERGCPESIPTEYADGMNLYQYVKGNPINYGDSSGESCASASLNLAAAAGAAVAACKGGSVNPACLVALAALAAAALDFADQCKDQVAAAADWVVSSGDSEKPFDIREFAGYPSTWLSLPETQFSLCRLHLARDIGSLLGDAPGPSFSADLLA